MTSFRLTPAAMLAACAVTVWWVPLQAADPIEGAPIIWPVTFDETGKRASPEEMAAIDKALAGRKPTDVFVISHGWLNDVETASTSYKELRDQMRAIAGKFQLTPSPFEPLVIGIFWPS